MTPFTRPGEHNTHLPEKAVDQRIVVPHFLAYAMHGMGETADVMHLWEKIFQVLKALDHVLRLISDNQPDVIKSDL